MRLKWYHSHQCQDKAYEWSYRWSSWSRWPCVSMWKLEVGWNGTFSMIWLEMYEVLRICERATKSSPCDFRVGRVTTEPPLLRLLGGASPGQAHKLLKKRILWKRRFVPAKKKVPKCQVFKKSSPQGNVFKTLKYLIILQPLWTRIAMLFKILFGFMLIVFFVEGSFRCRLLSWAAYPLLRISLTCDEGFRRSKASFLSATLIWSIS